MIIILDWSWIFVVFFVYLKSIYFDLIHIDIIYASAYLHTGNKNIYINIDSSDWMFIAQRLVSIWAARRRRYATLAAWQSARGCPTRTCWVTSRSPSGMYGDICNEDCIFIIYKNTNAVWLNKSNIWKQYVLILLMYLWK